jgi:cytoplasmic tRNA 2-thiolation protein 1
MPFQSEPCPHMNEGIRTDIREFLNSLENQRSGIKNNLYQSIIKVSKVMKKSNINNKERKNCEKCGSECTGNVCSVCTMVLKLKANQT